MTFRSLLLAAALAAATPAYAEIQPFPTGVRIEEIKTNGATIHTRVGGQGRRS